MAFPNLEGLETGLANTLQPSREAQVCRLTLPAIGLEQDGCEKRFHAEEQNSESCARQSERLAKAGRAAYAACMDASKLEELYAGLPVSLPLWEGRAPLAGEAQPGLPRATVYLPSEEHRTGQAIIICPGGGYGVVSMPKEGHRIARYVSSRGAVGVVLEYRHAPYHHPVPLLDAQRAIRLVRHHAEAWAVDPLQVGILGFSAGGHLAGTAACSPAVEAYAVGDAVDAHPCRPNFAVLVYPVVSLVADVAHRGSRRNLLGPNHEDALARSLSLEHAVTAATSPMLLIHTSEDEPVPPENSLLLYRALNAEGIPVELHIYERGPHGIGLAGNHPWGEALLTWLGSRRERH